MRWVPSDKDKFLKSILDGYFGRPRWIRAEMREEEKEEMTRGEKFEATTKWKGLQKWAKWKKKTVVIFAVENKSNAHDVEGIFSCRILKLKCCQGLKNLILISQFHKKKDYPKFR